MRRLLPTLALLALTAPVHAQEAPWPAAAHDGARTGTAPGPAPPYRELWAVDAPAGGAMAEPIVAEDRLLVLGRTGVAALSVEDGSVLWETGRAPGRAATPVVAGDLFVFVAGSGEDTELVARAVEDGTRAWTVDLGAAAFGSLAADDELVVVGTHDGGLLALDAATGEERWTFETRGGFDAAPALGDGIVVAAARRSTTGQSTLFGIDAASTGEAEPRWRFSPPGPAFLGGPAIGDGFAVVVSTEPVVRAIGLEGGRERWVSRARDGFESRNIPIAPDDVLAADRTHVYRFDATTGEEAWNFQVADLRALPGGGFNTLSTSDVALIGDAVLVGDAAGRLSAIDLDSGHRIWTGVVGDGPLSAPSAGAEGVYLSVLGEDGSVVALGTDPEGRVIDEVSPTVLFPGAALLRFVLAAAAVGAAILLTFRVLLRPRAAG